MSAATNTPAEPTATTTLVLSYSGVLYALADKTTTIEPTTPHHYSYPGVKEATAAQQLPYAVAHHC
jgi:hypothetical protein